jgi:glycolate oxidase FAD binding subunit
MPPPILEPSSAAAAGEILAQATASRTTIAVRGAGTKQSWSGSALVPDACLCTRRLSTPVQHFAGDLVATLPAGATLAEANAALARERQWLPLDPPHADRATIGGIVATNDSGPRRQLHGATRDLIIGIEVVLADGRVAHAGGRVVKNVAGYDLSRLICGSYGSLAVITSATFKLAPLPPSSRTIVITASDIGAMHEIATAIAAAPLSPSALELVTPPPRLLVRFETTELAAERQAELARQIAERFHASTDVVAGQVEAGVWREHDAEIWGGAGQEQADSVVKISVLPARVPETLLEIERATSARRLQYHAVGRASLGVLLVRLSGDPREQASIITAVRQQAAPHRGTATVLEACADVRKGLAAWEIGADAQSIMAAVKARFDPHQVLGPGALGLSSRRIEGGNSGL